MNVAHSILLSMTLTAILATSVRAELVVIVNPKSPAASMTAEEVANIYLGKDPRFVPVDLPESAVRADFYKKVTGKDPAQVKSLWARLVFTGQMLPPKEVSNSGDALKFVAGNDRGIAYVDKSAVDSSVKAVLTVN
jgi:hypothetical protein